MADEKLLTVREVAVTLGISEREVMNLAETGAIPAYKVGGVYLRFKKEQVLDYYKAKQLPTPKHPASSSNSLQDKISDFLYFNDFYIIATIITAIFLYIVFYRL